jgi:hypothetical protein
MSNATGHIAPKPTSNDPTFKNEMHPLTTLVRHPISHYTN